MADKGRSAKGSKRTSPPPDAAEGVLGNLPATRPARLGRKPRPASGAPESGTRPTAEPPPAGDASDGDTRPTAEPPPAGDASDGETRPAPESPLATRDADGGTRPARKPRKPAGTRAAVPPATDPPRRRRRAPVKERPEGPVAVRSGAPHLDPDVERDAPDQRDGAPRPPSGTELVTTAIGAVGDLARIGATVGAQALRRALGRLPRL